LKAQSASFIEEDEELHGGIVSPNLVRGYPRSYAFYMTNKRVIGAKKPKVGIGGLLGVSTRRPIGGPYHTEGDKRRQC
jgi:hypothetical protein